VVRVGHGYSFESLLKCPHVVFRVYALKEGLRDVFKMKASTAVFHSENFFDPFS
jgi:hypothetical protein